MTEEEKKTNDEEKTIPRPEGYTIVKYAFGWVLFISMLFGLVISAVLIVAFNDYFSETSGWLVGWLVWIMPLVVYALLWIIGRKITEVKVNLKITDEGLEQARLSGSRIYPRYRLIKWEDMKSFYPYGRRKGGQNFHISVRNNMNFRISVPVLILSKRQKVNSDILEKFRNDFWEIAPDHNVHVAYFAIT